MKRNYSNLEFILNIETASVSEIAFVLSLSGFGPCFDFFVDPSWTTRFSLDCDYDFDRSGGGGIDCWYDYLMMKTVLIREAFDRRMGERRMMMKLVVDWMKKKKMLLPLRLLP